MYDISCETIIYSRSDITRNNIQYMPVKVNLQTQYDRRFLKTI